MKRLVTILFLLSILATRGSADDPPVAAEAEHGSAEPTEDAISYLEARKALFSTRDEIARCIAAGRPEDAEAEILRYERDYAGSVRQFQFNSRMQIGDGYLSRGDSDSALRLYESSRPDGVCANCNSSKDLRRMFRIASIHESRWNLPAAFLSYLRALPSTLFGGRFLEVAWGLFRTGGFVVLPIGLGVVAWRRRRARKAP